MPKALLVSVFLAMYVCTYWSINQSTRNKSVYFQVSSSTSAMACGIVHWRSRPERTRCTPPPTSATIKVWMKASVASMMISTHLPLIPGVRLKGDQGSLRPLRQNLKVKGSHQKVVAGPLPITASLRRIRWISEGTDSMLSWMYCLVCCLGEGRGTVVWVNEWLFVCESVCVHACMCVCVFVSVSNPWARLFLGSGMAFLSPFSTTLGYPAHTANVDVKVMSVLSQSLVIHLLESTSHMKKGQTEKCAHNKR